MQPRLGRLPAQPSPGRRRRRLLAEQPAHADRLRAWAADPGAMFAQAWVSATATRPR
ncbi:hypothetical protein ACWEJ6_44935 [Nonomuraea sp. NPDC004702]